jgi:hypothetical protein
MHEDKGREKNERRANAGGTSQRAAGRARGEEKGLTLRSECVCRGSEGRTSQGVWRALRRRGEPEAAL